MNRIIVYLKSKAEKYVEELEFNGDLQISETLPHLIRFLSWPDYTSDGEKIEYWLTTANDSIVNLQQTFTDAGITNHSTLFIQSGSQIPKEALKGSSTKSSTKSTKPTQDVTPDPGLARNPQERRNIKSVPASWKKVN